LLFQDGASRNAAANGAVAHRMMVLNDETVEIIFEVHDAGRTPANLVITEFMAEPDTGFPEWVELENKDGFAANLTGWGLGRSSGGGLHTLIGDGALAGGSIILCSGKPNLQENQGAETVLDLGQSSILGRGAVDGLNMYSDTLSLTWTYPGTAQTYSTMDVSWDDGWEIESDISLQWNGGPASNSSNWARSNGGTPGSI
ncbi:MAG TPA: lamin tail domain-containing protein, partial [Candidatus Thalassarchaeaceae archaeon]|nr:lamin tail domain-containing protein [Candidatus Thalassarchaeaceae archaeon]